MAKESIERGSGWVGPLLAASAAVYVVVWIVGLGIAFSFPSADASAREWTDFLKSHQGLVIFQEYLIHGVAAVALLVFGAALRVCIRHAAGSSLLPDVAFAGAVAAASVSLVQATFGQVLTSKVAQTGDLALVSSFLALNNQADTYKLLGLALFVSASSFAFLKHHALPNWVAWGGGVVAILLLLGSWSFPFNSSLLGIALGLSLLGLLAWVAVVAVLMPGRLLARR